MMIIIVIIAIIMLLLGFEIFMVLGIPSLLLKQFFFGSIHWSSMVHQIVSSTDSNVLLALPFFIFSAEIMSQGKIANRLTTLVNVVIRRRRGGLGLTTVISSMLFGSVSGSAPATVSALGKLLYPKLRKDGYSEKFSLGLIVSSAETSLLIPPSITLIIYSWMSNSSIKSLFASGLIVGVILGIAFILLVLLETYKHDIKPSTLKYKGLKRRILKLTWHSLGLPIIIFVGIYSGIFTPTEAAAVSVAYAIIIEYFVYKSLTVKELINVSIKATITTSSIFILLAFGGLLKYFIIKFNIPDQVEDMLKYLHVNFFSFLLIVNIIFFIAGMFIDPSSAILILTPTLLPISKSLGIDPIHLGLIITLNVCIGMITPPFGLDIFVASSTLNKRPSEIIKGILPFLSVNIIVLLIITYIPQISTFIPKIIS